MSQQRRAGTTVLFAAAFVLNLAFDGLGWFLDALPPPHLLVRYMPEMIRGMVSPGVISPAASAALAAMDVLLLAVVPPAAARPVATLSAWLVGFWILSEGLLAWVWLSAPAGAVVLALLGGVVRSVAVAWVLVRLRGPAPGAP